MSPLFIWFSHSILMFLWKITTMHLPFWKVPGNLSLHMTQIGTEDKAHMQGSLLLLSSLLVCSVKPWPWEMLSAFNLSYPKKELMSQVTFLPLTTRNLRESTMRVSEPLLGNQQHMIVFNISSALTIKKPRSVPYRNCFCINDQLGGIKGAATRRGLYFGIW